MKYLLNVISAITMSVLLFGCQTVPSTDSMYKLGAATGYTTAYVLNKQVSLDTETRNAIVQITTEVEQYIPATNETFCSTWTPMVKELTDGYVKDGKLTQAQADRVVKDFSYITSLLDNYIEKKGVKEYQELVEAFVHGFCGKFLNNFKPANSSFSTTKCDLDDYTIKFLESQMKN